MKRNIWMAVCLGLWQLCAHAGDGAMAVVDSVRMPAWLEREGRAQPLQPGQTLRAGDQLRTGREARVYLQLAEGSTVKLGAGAHFEFKGLERREDVFAAALGVLRGAFRFTTGAVARGLHKRDVSIHVASVTAGIRGTDIWGRSDDKADFVCLLEGRISVSHSDGTVGVMAEPLTFFKAPKGQGPDPIAPVAADQVARWAEETEIAPDSGAARQDGRWRVLLGTFANERVALALYVKVREQGYAARLLPAGVPGKRWFRVQLDGFASHADAQAMAQEAGRLFQLQARAVRTG